MTTASSPVKVFRHFLCEDDAAERCAGNQRRLAGRELADIDRMEAIDVLGGIDEVQHLLAIDVFGQRQLDENAVHGTDRD